MGGVVPKVGRNFIQTVSIEGFPLESTPGMLNILSELPGVYRWSSRYIFMDTHEAVAHLDQYRKSGNKRYAVSSIRYSTCKSSHVDEDALNMTEDAQSAIAETNSGFVAQVTIPALLF